MTDAAEAQVVRALARAGLYRLLGGALGYPRDGSGEELAGLARAAGAAIDTPASLREPLARFAAAAAAADPAALASEYVFLFDREARCPPYEGAYAEAPQLAGKPAALADIAGFYAAFGLEPAAAEPELEDHIAAELEFMSVLGLKEAYALAEGHGPGLGVTRAAAAAFFGDHLGRWAVAFAEAVKEATAVPYYAALADLLAAWIVVEGETLGSPPRRPGPRGADPVQEEDAFTCPMAEECQPDLP